MTVARNVRHGTYVAYHTDTWVVWVARGLVGSVKSGSNPYLHWVLAVIVGLFESVGIFRGYISKVWVRDSIFRAPRIGESRKHYGTMMLCHIPPRLAKQWRMRSKWLCLQNTRALALFKFMYVWIPRHKSIPCCPNRWQFPLLFSPIWPLARYLWPSFLHFRGNE